MLYRRDFVSVWIALFACSPAAGQDAIQVTEKELRNAASQKFEPEYPAVARQIRVTGDVELQITVDPTGAVDRVTVLHGNTLLTGASTQAVKKWKFVPFHSGGQPVRAIGPIRFSFQM